MTRDYSDPNSTDLDDDDEAYAHVEPSIRALPVYADAVARIKALKIDDERRRRGLPSLTPAPPTPPPAPPDPVLREHHRKLALAAGVRPEAVTDFVSRCEWQWPKLASPSDPSAPMASAQEFVDLLRRDAGHLFGPPSKRAGNGHA